MIDVLIKVGKVEKTGKWQGTMTLPDGRSLGTKVYDTQAECRMAIQEWLDNNSISFDWSRTH